MGKWQFSAQNGAEMKLKKNLTHDCLQNAANKSPSQTASILCTRFPSKNLFSAIFWKSKIFGTPRPQPRLLGAGGEGIQRRNIFFYFWKQIENFQILKIGQILPRMVINSTIVLFLCAFWTIARDFFIVLSTSGRDWGLNVKIFFQNSWIDRKLARISISRKEVSFCAFVL